MTSSDPLMATLCARGHIDAFDMMLSRKIQKKTSSWLGIYVSRAFRQGHMAVTIGDQKLFPTVERVFVEDGVSSLEARDAEAITQNIRAELAAGSFGSDQLIVEGQSIALPRAHAVEDQLARHMVRLVTCAPFVQVQSSFFDESLNSAQRAAVDGAMKTAVCLITGGPGTGKTYTAGVFLKSLLCQVIVKPLRVALLAPTGRAVQNLENSIRRMVEDDGSLVVEAKTIHSVVASSKSYLPYHLVIIDECSMIDSDMMVQLLQRLHSGTRVMMLGDPDQLPSIDPGQPFFDFLKVANEGKKICHYSLTECRRTASQELLELSSLVRSGDGDRFSEWFGSKDEGDVRCVACVTQEDWQRAETIIENEIVLPWGQERSLHDSLDQLRKATLLTTGRRGPLGTETINARACKNQGIFSPVLCVKNSYQLGVMNGDIGIHERHGDLIHFHHCSVPAVLCPRVERAYAMTVHKSQGSEFDTVVVVVPPGALFDRRLIYTAMTRAKRRVVLIGQRKDFLQAMGHCDERMSTLARRLRTALDDEYGIRGP